VEALQLSFSFFSPPFFSTLSNGYATRYTVSGAKEEDNLYRGNAIIIDTCAGYVRRVTHDEIADAVG
jgi:hypothetical protein